MSMIRSRSIGSAVHHFNPYPTENLLTITGLIWIYIATTPTLTLTLCTNHESVNVSLVDGNKCCYNFTCYWRQETTNCFSLPELEYSSSEFNSSRGRQHLTKYSRISLIRTPKGQSKESVLERCPYKRGHYDVVTFITPLTVLSVQ